MAVIDDSGTPPLQESANPADLRDPRATYYFCSEFDNPLGDLEEIVHGCLFAVESSRFLIALERHCWTFFVASRLSSQGTRQGAPWSEYVLSNNLDPEDALDKMSCYRVTEEGWTVQDNGGVPSAVAVALRLYPGTVDRSLDTGIIDDIDSGFVKVACTPAQLARSLSYDNIIAKDRSPFVALSQFFEDVLDMTHEKSVALSAEGLWYKNVSTSPIDPGGVTRQRTSARGLSARSLFTECFNTFRKVFSAAEGSDDHPRLSRTPDKVRSNYGLDNVGEYTKYLIPFDITHPLSGVSGDPDLFGSTAGSSFQFCIPTTFRRRKTDMQEACDALGPTTEFTLFTDVTKALEQENKSVARGLSHLGAIADTLQDKRVEIGSVTVGSSAVGIIDEFFPRAGEPAPVGREVISRIGSPHVSSVYKTLEKRLPFVGLARGLPNAAAFLPLAKTTSGSPGGVTKGRLAALKLLLSSPNLTVSEENLFDPTNTRVFCVGIPLSAFTSVVSKRVTSIPEVATPGGQAGLSITERELVQDNSLIKITFTKKDNMLPTIRFSGISYYYDPNLFVAADGFFDVDENSESIEDILHLVRFKRAVVSSDNVVSLESVTIDEEGSFTGGGYLTSLSSGVSRQLAYVTVMSDLLSFYTSLVSGIDPSEEAFCTVQASLNQLIDSSVGVESQILIDDLVRAFASSTNVPVSQDVASSAIADDISLQSSKRIKSFNEAVNDGTLGQDDLPANYVQAQRSFSSLLFRPESERIFALSPKRFSGVAFLPIDPDTFRVDNPEITGFGSGAAGEDPNVVRAIIQDAGIELESGDSVFIVKSGNSEDATSLNEIIVEAEYVSLSPGGIEGALPIENGIPNDPLDSIAAAGE